jgi:hypothetical protein
MNTKKLMLVFTFLATLIFQVALPGIAFAAGTVGSGTPASCTESALNTALAGGGAVSFNCGGPVTIILTSTKVITTNTQIDGAGLITLSGNNVSRLFTVNSPATLGLSNLTISNGFASSANGGAILINSGATLNIANSTFSGNRVMDGYGGAIYVGGGTLNVTNSTFTNNNANVESFGDFALGGGAIQNNDGTVTISRSTFNGNSVTSHTGDGGAIYNGDFDAGFVGTVGIPDEIPDVLNITNSTFYDNHILNTSGLPSAGNSAGAIRSASAVTITQSTFSNNDSGISEPNGEAGAVTITHGSATLINNIFANSSATDCAIRDGVTTLNSSGNLIENNFAEPLGCGVPLVTTDPLLGPLQNNYGFTQTMALGVGSPAIDILGSCPIATDQRGLVRPQGNLCDIGAYEVDKAPVLISFTRQNPAASPTNVDTLVFRATFDKEVTAVDTGDFMASGTTATVTNVAAVNSSTYDITVSGGNLANLNGVVGLNLNPAQNILDLFGTALPNTEPATSETYTLENTLPSVSTILRADPNPTSASSVSFAVTFSENVSGVDTADFGLTTTGSISGASVTSVSGSGSTYTVVVNTGSGSGDVRLDLIFNGTIHDAAGNDLSGAHIGDESYTIDRDFPVVSSIVRSGANPTNLNLVSFTVTFSRSVTGVDTSAPFVDFALTTTGVSGASIAGVSGSGSSYTVTVNSGSGNGTIRLDVVDDDSIKDANNKRLGGLGSGNGNYSAGEVYSIAKIATTLVNSVLPTSRSVQVGTTATVFNTIVNGGSATAYSVNIAMANPPAGMFSYQESSCATNVLLGGMNPVLDIPAGQARCYVLFFTPSAPFAATDIHIRAQAFNAPATNLLPGINTWMLRATSLPGPDMIALTTTTDFHQVSCQGTKPFAVAIANVGAATSPVIVTADTGSASLPISILVQESNPSTGVIIGDHILENVGAGDNRTVVVWVTFNGCIGFDPATHRIFIRFKDSDNNLIGSTSTAVSTNR